MFEHASILPVDDYASQLFDMLASLSPRKVDFPRVVVLTPGIYNSAYFEHSYLAQRMGVDLVEGADLVVADDECVYVRTIRGLERVDVIYRRINDTFLDPECFDKDSVLGVPGLMRAWRAQATSRSRTRRAPVSPTTRSCTRTCRRSSSTTWARRRSCRTCRRYCCATTRAASMCSPI